MSAAADIIHDAASARQYSLYTRVYRCPLSGYRSLTLLLTHRLRAGRSLAHYTHQPSCIRPHTNTNGIVNHSVI